eukprot:scaffold94165_cov38-Prasinocladus_malaysianus.AAC.1
MDERHSLYTFVQHIGAGDITQLLTGVGLFIAFANTTGTYAGSASYGVYLGLLTAAWWRWAMRFVGSGRRRGCKECQFKRPPLKKLNRPDTFAGVRVSGRSG